MVLPVSHEPAQVHTVTCQLAQATAWQGVPRALGVPGRCVVGGCFRSLEETLWKVLAKSDFNVML